MDSLPSVSVGSLGGLVDLDLGFRVFSGFQIPRSTTSCLMQEAVGQQAKIEEQLL